MQFCPKCKSLMVYTDNKAVCKRCGYEMELNPSTLNSNLRIVSKCKTNGDVPIIEEDVCVLPTTDVICPNCGNNKAYWWMRQLRAADESEVRFYKCTKCGKIWREYD